MTNVYTPSFLYRTYLYKKMLKTINLKGPFLEIGVGSGEFLKYLSVNNYFGLGLDFSEDVIEGIDKKELNPNIDVKHGDFMQLQDENKYNIIFAFEVLEHIKDDSAFVRKAVSLLQNNGTFIFSVPANKKKFGQSDREKGHYRRYDKEDIIDLFNGFPCKIEKIWNYGFPFISFIRKIDKKSHKTIEDLGQEQRTMVSGITNDYNNKWNLIFSEKKLKPLFLFMNLMLCLNLGVGYIVKVKRN